MSINPSLCPSPASGPATPVDDFSREPVAEPGFTAVRVVRKLQVARDIWLFELRDAAGRPLRPFTAGAHLTAMVPNGSRRNYSLCSDPADTVKYEIAVKRDAAGRGGSVSMVDDVQEGQWLQVSEPRNNFELASHAKDFIFVAGGIGITPILSMMRHLKGRGDQHFKLYYCTRDAGGTAFADTLSEEFPGQVEIHHDEGDPAKALDFWPLLEKPGSAHVYCCGPRGLMEGVADMSGHWPPGNIHFESFGVDAKAEADNQPFRVTLARTSTTLEVDAHQSILGVLRAAGLRVPSSCESGTCGSCKTRLLAGDADHRDMVLSDEEKADHIMVCVSRAQASAAMAELVLDL